MIWKCPQCDETAWTADSLIPKKIIVLCHCGERMLPSRFEASYNNAPTILFRGEGWPDRDRKKIDN